ncbi:Pmr5/Cas1p GDSL/SGNH-like acyl-esterase family protein [Medicago truncatula]|uniref:Pmr5/Cas1p GDSL/SGNH-like acyl-esterase family protein n=1 Tax=Medicago truncatula TaxID=3880 RepID=G7IWA7_MEDTR|nr:Pmr5/Cas1p GDSL/SGNH-like acyl-esterase family protein [Medicago truncatula]
MATLTQIGETPISWSSKKKEIMALSSCEVDYVEAYYSICQALCIQILLEELDVFEAEKRSMYRCRIRRGYDTSSILKYQGFRDNKSTIDLGHLANHPESEVDNNGAEWHEPGVTNCAKETTPINGSSFSQGLAPASYVLQNVLQKITKLVQLLNVTMDCTHWCIAGVPDTWNEILYASIIN